MRSVQKTRVKLFQLSFSTGGSSRKSRVFRLDPPVGILSRKKSSRKGPFSTVEENSMWASVEKGRFDGQIRLYKKWPKVSESTSPKRGVCFRELGARNRNLVVLFITIVLLSKYRGWTPGDMFDVHVFFSV